MKVLFFGTPYFAEVILQGLLDSEFDVVGVVCQTDKPAGRGNKLVSPKIVSLAKENGVQVYQFEKLSEHIEDFKKIDYDIAVTASYGKILPKQLLDLKLCINVHPSLLPKYRGSTPIQSALLNGDVLTGVSIMKTEVGMDDGDIYSQEEVEILPEDDYNSLQDKLASVGLKLLLETLKKIELRKEKRTPQDDSKATFVKLIDKQDALLDFSENVNSLVNKVRAFAENPVAYLFIGGERIKIYKARVEHMSSSANAGEIIEHKKRFFIQAKGGVFEILKCQAPGGKVLDASSFLNGYRFKAKVVDA